MCESQFPVTYEKPARFPVPGKEIPQDRPKRNLSERLAKYLLSGKVAVEEKMDGRQCQFMTSEGGLAVFAEDLRRKHSIPYRVPGRYAVFDIFDIGRGVFLFPDEKTKLALALRKGTLRVMDIPPSDFFPIPQVANGRFQGVLDISVLIRLSEYAINPDTTGMGYMEGVVVKPYRDLFPFEQIRGKIIKPEFDTDIDEHYLRQPEERNIIDPRLSVVLSYDPPVSITAQQFYAN